MNGLRNACCVVALMASTSGVAAQQQNAEPSPEAFVRSFMQETGTNISWERSEPGTFGQTKFHNVKINRYGKTISVKEMKTDGFSVILIDLRVKALYGGDGSLTADSVIMTDLGGFWQVFNAINATPEMPEGHIGEAWFDPELVPDEHYEPVCGGLKEDGVILRRVTANNVSITGDPDAMPSNIPGMEQINFDKIEEIYKMQLTGDVCSFDTDQKITAIEVRAIDGASGRIGSAQINARNKADIVTADHQGAESILLQDLTMENSAGVISARAQDVLFSSASDQEMAAIICDVTLPMGEIDSKKLLAHANLTKAGQNFTVTGLEISVPEFFPDYMIDAMGLQDLGMISGDVALRGSIDGGVVTSESDISIPGLLVGSLNAKFSLPSSLDVTLPGFIADKLPIPGELLDLKIHSFDASFDDQGAGDIVETVTGILPADHVANAFDLALVRVKDKLPGFMLAKLKASGETIVEMVSKGGRVSISPKEPVTVMSLAMQGMMDPEGLTEKMGVSVDIME